MNKTVVWVGFGMFAVLGLVIGLVMPFQPKLDPLGHQVLMVLFITIGFWIFKPAGVSFTAASALFMGALLAMGLAPGKIFSGFTSGAVWTLIPALFFGFVLSKTGLGKRIAYLGMKSTLLSYSGILIMWAVIGVVLSVLTPSITVRVVIVTPIALNCAELCALEKGSKGRSLILLTAWAMAVIPGTGWTTGSLGGPIISGLFAGVAELGTVDFNTWLQVAMLPAALASMLLLILGYFILKPQEPLSISRDTFNEEYKKLGLMTRDEKVAAVTLSVAFAFLATASIHRLPDAAVCLTALFALCISGVIKMPEINSGISWDLVIFFGVAISLSAIFAVSGISAWLPTLLVPVFTPLAHNPWLFCFAVLIALFAWRFIDVAIMIPTMAVLVPILPKIAAVTGVNPLVWIPIFNMSYCCFFLSYQNVFAVVAEANMGGNGWTADHFFRYGIAYLVACLLTLMATIPYWSSLGMFS